MTGKTQKGHGGAPLQVETQRIPVSASGGSASERDVDPLIGTKYKTLREIGHGGMGTVYLAEHKELGRSFAVKVLLPALSADEKNIEPLFPFGFGKSYKIGGKLCSSLTLSFNGIRL